MNASKVVWACVGIGIFAMGIASCSAGGDRASGAGANGSAASSGNGGNGSSGSGGEGGITLVGSGGSTSGTGGVGGGCATVSQTAENQVIPVDIIWAIDTSDSMVGELKATQDNMNQFAQTILNAGIDVHVVLVAKPGKPDGGTVFNPDPGICIGPPLATGTCPGGSKPPNYQHVEVGVGSNNALNKLIETYPIYKGTLRQNSIKYFAVVTDDDATSGPNNSAPAFIASVNALDPGWFDQWKFFGVFCTGSCGVFLACADTGDVYKALVAQKGGIAGDLCGGNSNGFASVFTALAQTVVQSKTLDCSWKIPPPPDGETFDKSKVNVEYTGSGGKTSMYYVLDPATCGAQGGWYYDDPVNPTSIKVCPSTCTTFQADPMGKVDILFGCDTVVVPN
jgi:hypothetical protein